MNDKIDWAAAYNRLYHAGYTDGQIAELAGTTRVTINRVRNGTWGFKHELSYSGGNRILDAIQKLTPGGGV